MTDLTGRTAVVTGASAGIGAAAARQLHALGAEVVVVGRSPAKTAAVAAEVGGTALTADFADLSQVRALAAQLAELPRIDILLDNAGGTWPRAEMTADGHERTLQINHLAPYLLTRLLQDQLIRSRARIVITASDAHRFGRLDLDKVDTPDGYRGMRNYGAAKLANILFAVELQRRWGTSGIVATSAHPGVVTTEFGRNSSSMGWLYRLGTPFMVSPDKAADTLVWLATAPESAGWIPGGYHAKSAPARSNGAGRDAALARALWDRSAAWVGLPAD